MTFAVLLLAVAFTLLMLFKALEPFFVPRDEQLSIELIGDDLREVETLVAQRAALVLALRDLEYDWETAKISDEDYKRFRRSYERQAVAAMRRLDAIHGGRDWHETIEEALKERLAEDAPPEDLVESATLSEAAKAKTTEKPAEEQAPLQCTKCSASLNDDDLFCSKCGTPVSSSSSAEVEAKDQEAPQITSSQSEATALPISDELSPSSPAEVSQ